MTTPDLNALIERLEAWAPLIASGLECPAASTAMIEAVQALRAIQSEREPEQIAESANCSPLDGEVREIVETPLGPEPHEQAVKWHLPTILRSIAAKSTMGYDDSGSLASDSIRAAADKLEQQAADLEDNGARHWTNVRNENARLRAEIERLSTAQQEAGWQPIETAPYSTPVEVRAGDMIFLAQLEPDASMTSDEQSCDQWQAVNEGEHPPCWSGGACWELNENECESLQPYAWRLPAAPAIRARGEG